MLYGCPSEGRALHNNTEGLYIRKLNIHELSRYYDDYMDVLNQRNSNGTVIALQLLYATHELNVKKERFQGHFYETINPGLA